MKTIHANGLMVINLAVDLTGIMLIVAGLAYWEELGMASIVTGILLIIVVSLACIIRYRSHWIKIGEGKVIVCHETKKIKKSSITGWAKPVGRWQKKEDEILVEEIEIYGYTLEVVKNANWVEYNRSRGGGGLSTAKEICIILKDGRKIGFEATYYTIWQQEEILNYLRDETGIERKR